MKKNREVYLDNNATTKIDKRVIDEMVKVMEGEYGNPSSVYRIGQRSKKIIEEARELISGLLGVKSREIVFTSGGTEANNFAIRGITKELQSKGKHIVSTNIEHSSVKNTLLDLVNKGFEVTFVEVEKNGIVDPKKIEKAVREDTVLITVMHSNNEIGTLQPIEEIGEIAKKNDILFHVDAVQSIGKERVDVTNIDTLTLAAHKFYGPKGVGVLYIKSGTKMDKLVTGGQQERNRRAGTENVSAIHGMAVALEIALSNYYEESKREKELRDYLEERLLSEVQGLRINGDRKNRLNNTSNISVEGVEAESLLMSLDIRGIAVSAGSACASSTLTPSHVLEAIGLSKVEAKGSIRISLGRFTTKDDLDYFIENLKDIIKIEREMSIF